MHKQADIFVPNQEGPTTKGVHIFSLCDMRSTRAQTLSEKIEAVAREHLDLVRLRDLKLRTAEELERLFNEHWKKYHYFLQQLNSGFLLRRFVVENITTTAGRTVIAQRLSGTTTYTGIVNYGAVGTGTTAPAVGQTQLVAETYRKGLSSGTNAANIAYLENFYNATEVTGTLEEFAFFIDGTGSANTGQMFNRFTQTIVKSNTESLNVQSSVTVNDA